LDNNVSTGPPLAPEHTVAKLLTKHSPSHPRPVKTRQQLLFLLGESSNLGKNSEPDQPPIFKHSFPNRGKDLLIGPNGLGENPLIPLRPNSPKARPLQQGPQRSKFFEPHRECVLEDDLIPLHSRPWPQVGASGTELVKQQNSPVPHPLR
jgi:hypothetical protein